MTGACALTGGIATLNLNILRALNDLAEERKMRLTVFSYLEKDGDRPDFLREPVNFHGFAGNRRRLVRTLVASAIARPTLCFDHVTVALPVLRADGRRPARFRDRVPSGLRCRPTHLPSGA